MSGRKRKATEGQIAAAFVQDRAEQYRNTSGSRAALEEVAEQLRKGEHLEAHKHGEIDDLLSRSS